MMKTEELNVSSKQKDPGQRNLVCLKNLEFGRTRGQGWRGGGEVGWQNMRLGRKAGARI